jgi:hypothetical protein
MLAPVQTQQLRPWQQASRSSLPVRPSKRRTGSSTQQHSSLLTKAKFFTHHPFKHSFACSTTLAANCKLQLSTSQHCTASQKANNQQPPQMVSVKDYCSRIDMFSPCCSCCVHLFKHEWHSDQGHAMEGCLVHGVQAAVADQQPGGRVAQHILIIRMEH